VVADAEDLGLGHSGTKGFKELNFKRFDLGLVFSLPPEGPGLMQASFGAGPYNISA
jgi:hypothetical protein